MFYGSLSIPIYSNLPNKEFFRSDKGRLILIAAMTVLQSIPKSTIKYSKPNSIKYGQDGSTIMGKARFEFDKQIRPRAFLESLAMTAIGGIFGTVLAMERTESEKNKEKQNVLIKQGCITGALLGTAMPTIKIPFNTKKTYPKA